jgi:hypothetical protein
MAALVVEQSDLNKILGNIRVPEKSGYITAGAEIAKPEYYPCQDGDCCASIVGACVRDEMGRSITTR